MKYNFTDYIDRSGWDIYAVDVEVEPGSIPPGKTKPEFDRIPMWVADMNFGTAPSIMEEIQNRVQHPTFGYFHTPDRMWNAIIKWHKDRYGTEITREDLDYQNGVLGGVVSALHVVCQMGDKVLIHAPTYIGFSGLLENNGYEIVHSDLIQDEDGNWFMDFDDMEAKIRDQHIHAFIFCNPHNPAGRVWTQEELEKAYAIFKKYDVKVICDEIWADITLFGNKHIPLYSVNEDAASRTMCFYSIGKTFNAAAFVCGFSVCKDPYLRDQLAKETSLSHYNDLNVFSMHAMYGGFDRGGEWVDELQQVLSDNVDYAYDFVKTNWPEVKVAKPEGTYMFFLDCKDWCDKHGVTIDELQTRGVEYGVIWQDGRPFGGEATIRMNLALPLGKMKEAFDRLKEYVFV